MKQLIILPIVFFLTGTVFSQGCSDAGFCTIDAFKAPNTDSLSKTMKNQLKFGTTIGKADRGVRIGASYVEYIRKFSPKWSADFKCTQLLQSGNGITTSGVSDLFATAGYTGKKKMTYTIGMKVPFSDGNKTHHGLSLPNDYQASLGTLDLITGIAGNIGALRITSALQQPLTQSKNGFDPLAWDSISPFRQFTPTNGFHRKGDALLRCDYSFTFRKHWIMVPGVLAIYHLGRDQYTDAAGNIRNIDGSDGLTLNLTGVVRYAFNPHHRLELNGGTPVIVRKTRPDGLTRSFVLTLEYRWSF